MASRRRTSLALAVLLVLAGCLGGTSAPEATSPGQTSTEATTSPTPTTAETSTETATLEDCSRDANASTLSDATLSNVSKPANLTRGSARSVAETVESAYQSARVEEHSYFNYHASVGSAEAVEGGYRVVISAELDYDHRGNESGTITHVHRPYTVSYRVTDRQVVRRGEAGVTGTVGCW